MLTTFVPRQPAPILACGATWLRRHGGPNAFGNQLGQSLAEAMLPRSAVVNTARSGGLPFADDQTLVLRDGGPAPNPEATRSFVDTLGGMMVRQRLETVSLAGTTQYADAQGAGTRAEGRSQLVVDGLQGKGDWETRVVEFYVAREQRRQAQQVQARNQARQTEQALTNMQAMADAYRDSGTSGGATGDPYVFTIESAALASVAAEPLSPAMQHVEVALKGAAGVVTEAPATLYDLAQVAYGVAYTELTGHAPDLTMRSSQGTAAQGGASTGELLQNLNPVYSGLVAQYEVREALKRGDTRPLAAIGAGLLTGAAMGRMLPSVPGYRPRGPTSFGNANFAGSIVTRDGSFSHNVSWFDRQVVLDDMATSNIGRQVLNAAESNKFRLEFSKSYYRKGPNGAVEPNAKGYAFPTKAKIYLPAHTSNKQVALTAIHEGVHELGVVGSQRAEALARLAELQHQGVEPSISTMRGVIRDIRSAVYSDNTPVYTNMPWKLGEESTAFPGVWF